MYPYYYTYHYHFSRQYDARFLNDLQRAINGEFSAIRCYEKLAEITENEEARKQILEIRDDERRHFQSFSNIYTNLTGKEPVPKITEECPGTYREGLIAAFKDEQETVDFYLDLADRLQDTFVKETFRRAAADEQNHAVWFSYFLMGNVNAQMR